MAKKPKPVSVGVDFTGTYVNGRWTGTQPVWTVPDKVKVKPGDHSIIWTLEPANVPTGFTAAFASDPNGIAFNKPSNSVPWLSSGRTAPSKQPDGTVVAGDDNDGQVGSLGSFGYSITVAVTPAVGAAQSFVCDPVIENEPGPLPGDEEPAPKPAPDPKPAK